MYDNSVGGTCATSMEAREVNQTRRPLDDADGTFQGGMFIKICVQHFKDFGFMQSHAIKYVSTMYLFFLTL